MIRPFLSRLFIHTSLRQYSPVVAVAQLTSTDDKASNFEICSALASEARSSSADFVFFPEMFSYMNRRGPDTVSEGEFLDSELIQAYCSLARENSLYISYGGFYERDIQLGDSHVYNTHFIVDDAGEIVSIYRKLHRFDVDLPDVRLRESDFVARGTSVVTCNDTPCGTLGLSTCYDIRFPELYAFLAREGGASTLLIPSAFTRQTGRRHWKVLIQARAIETQSFVIAAAQTGEHHPGRESFGHAMVVDPFGEILLDIDPEETGVIGIVDVDLERVETVRRNMPCSAHRNDDVIRIVVEGFESSELKKGTMQSTTSLPSHQME